MKQFRKLGISVLAMLIMRERLKKRIPVALCHYIVPRSMTKISSDILRIRIPDGQISSMGRSMLYLSPLFFCNLC